MKYIKFGFIPFLWLIMLSNVSRAPIHAFAEDNLNLSQAESTAPSVPKTALQVTPVFNELAVKRGEAVSRDISVTNLSPVALPIKAYTRAFVASDESGGSDYPDETTPKAVQHWFLIDTPDFILQSGASNVVHVIITIPANAEPGGHYATLFFESLIPKEALSENSLYLASRIGVPFFMVVAGDISRNGLMSTHVQSVYFSLPVNVTLSFHNIGNVHLGPKSIVTIVNWRGQTLRTIQDGGQVALPGKTRTWRLDWSPHFAFGRYVVHTESVLEDGVSKQQSDHVFWVIPLTPLLSSTTIFLLTLFIATRGRRRLAKALRVLGGRG